MRADLGLISYFKSFYHWGTKPLTLPKIQEIDLCNLQLGSRLALLPYEQHGEILIIVFQLLILNLSLTPGKFQ